MNTKPQIILQEHMETLAYAKEVFSIKSAAIAYLADQLTTDFEKAVQYILRAGEGEPLARV